MNHTRHLYCSRGDFWIVVDEVETDRPRKIDALWHWHPTCKIAVEGSSVSTENERGNLQVIPVGKQQWKIRLVEGEEEPEIQGWYSREYNEYEPNVTSIYTTEINSGSSLYGSCTLLNRLKRGSGFHHI